ncbi:MAG: DNA translocase FtsK 4TM domain-containing protein, partial [Geobacter sp.]
MNRPVDDARKEKLKKELQGMGLAALGIFILLAFLTFSAADQSLNSWSSEGGVRNLGGRLGSQVADLFFMLFGLAAYLVPGALLFLASNLLRFKELRLRGYKLAAFSGLLFSLSALFAFNLESTVLFGQQVPTGGAIGALTVRFLRAVVGTTGALLVLLPLLAASIMILCRFSFVLFAGWWLETMRQKWTAWRERQAHRKDEQQRDKALAAGKPAPSSGPVIKPQAPPPPPPKPNFFKKEKKKEAAKDKPIQETFDFITQQEGFHTPPLSLLDPPPASDRRVDKEALAVNARLLEKKLL